MAKSPRNTAEAATNIVDDPTLAHNKTGAPRPDPRPRVPDSETKERDIHAEAMKRYQTSYDRDRHNQEAELEDLEFEAGHQWPERYFNERKNAHRPTLTINQTAQFVKLITGDVRQFRPSIRVYPTDARGAKETAEILQDQIRYIENSSNARYAYAQGNQRQVIAGIGHWRVTTEYGDETTLNQEIAIEPCDGQVVWDADSNDPTRKDAMYCFVYVDMNRDAFNERYPDHQGDGDFERSEVNRGRDASINITWNTDEFIRLAEYWKKEPITRRLIAYPDGSLDDLTDDPDAEAKTNAVMNDRLMAQYEGRNLDDVPQVVERPGFRVYRYLLTSNSIIEWDEWPGRYIPIIPAVGEETRIARKVIRKGIVRNLMDPQRRYNYFVSAETEIVALQPKAPWIGTETNFAVDNDRWETANVENHAYLTYIADPENGGIPPQRGMPPMASTGLTQGIELAHNDMMMVTGKYPASRGAASNETSGRAIAARQRQGDVTSYVYVDNMALAIQHTGRVIIDLIPHIYDTERMIAVMNADGETRLEAINRRVIDPENTSLWTVMNDVTVGSYDVVMETGPSYATKREEARESLIEFARTVPGAAELIPDLIAKAQDWPGSDRIAERFRRTLPPEILDDKERQELPDRAPPPPPPEVLAEQAKIEAKEAEQRMSLEAKQAEQQMDLEYQRTKNEQDIAYQQAKNAIDLQQERLQLALDREKALVNLSNQKSRVIADISARTAKGESTVAQEETLADLEQMEATLNAMDQPPPASEPPLQ